MSAAIAVSTLTDRVSTLDNPYWDAVRPHVQPGEYPFDTGLQIGGLYNPDAWAQRHDLVHRYSWSVTDPATVAFIAAYAGAKVVDPMAGTGYWAYLLRQLGIAALAYDLYPPNRLLNAFHRLGLAHCRVGVSSGTAAVARNGAGRTLLLSWPPYNTGAGADVLDAYPGDRVIYIGEGAGGCTGDDRMHDILDERWTEVACHRPVQYFGIRDYVTVYDRRVAR